MAINNEHIVKLAAKWEAGTISDSEQLELDNWYREHQDDPLEVPQLVAATEYDHKLKIWNAIQDKIQVKYVALWPRIAVAASIALAVTVGGYFYYNNQNSKVLQAPFHVADIAPGKSGATLTLANGKAIRLSEVTNGEIAKESGVSVTKTADGELVYEIKGADSHSDKINTLTTANGETYILTLPDKSRVWLNAASGLTYATSLNERGERRVKLSGEAYFEISKDKAHPFIVESRGQNIEVLGTHFNVSSYADEAHVKTTLLEGSVKVSANAGQMKDAGLVKILKPGQQSLLGDDGLSVRQADIETDLAWKNGDFVFDHEDFESIIRKVEKWYDVKFNYQKGKYNTLTLSGSVSRSNPLSVVLVSLQKAGNLKFKVEGRRVTIM